VPSSGVRIDEPFTQREAALATHNSNELSDRRSAAVVRPSLAPSRARSRGRRAPLGNRLFWA